MVQQFGCSYLCDAGEDDQAQSGTVKSMLICENTNMRLLAGYSAAFMTKINVLFYVV